MTSEHAFLRQRLALVEHLMAHADQDLIYEGRGRVRRRTRPASKRDVAHERETRLLRKLLASTPDGRVTPTLAAWRRQLEDFLRKHRQQHQAMQDAYDAWWRLPPYKQERTPQPPKPPLSRYVDQEGVPWIIDDHFLALLDDLTHRLQKWQEES